MRERFLVTGAHGCIGAWVIRRLVSEGAHVVALDLSDDAHRLEMVLSASEVAALPTVRTDITDLDSLERTLAEHEITNVIHLAALQVPFCRADPSLGARVNVVGTVNVLEAVARRSAPMAPVVYASSIAAYDAADADAGAATEAGADTGGGVPGTLYGVYKRANEGTAALYWTDREVASVGLRPHTVYGPGRDQGLTSSPTAAMLAAAAGRPFEIPFGGRFQFQYAPDVAAAFILASRSPARSATVHNLSSRAVHMSDVVAAIEAAEPAAAGTITFVDHQLPFPAEADHASLREIIGEPPETPLQEGVADTMRRFRELIAAGSVSAEGPAAPV
ncbi:MAG TPA: NAD(P)-dependent oxidoreductase [Solirubrobacteraceae bacterium]|jgi:UDP-glucuronate 4-epimerase|nr:NAD(P)-dependent oxidoreductase [Solirubrobacteraceae bacterium]